jgi:hypothetical protein
MLSSGAPWVLRIGMVITYFMNGAYTPATLGIAMSLLLWPRQSRDQRVSIGTEVSATSRPIHAQGQRRTA